ncbi:MAG: phosphoribosylformylglycinamidine synthase [Chloroflexi bacterium]|jgi:phosphoribosylformylglycinamidine synthase|nr:phosphoribosylformylglycinamidine synthase [Chloroflexota bacterium]
MLYCVELLPQETLTTANRLAAEAAGYFGESFTSLKHHAFYLLQFDPATSPEAAEKAAAQAAQYLLADPVAQTYRSGPVGSFFKTLASETTTALVLAANRPGVTDAEGESALQGYRVMAASGKFELPNLLLVRAASLYYLDLAPGTTPEKLGRFSRLYLINDLVQDCLVFGPGQIEASGLINFTESQFNFSQSKSPTVKTVAVRETSDADLEKISREGLLALNLAEMQAIQSYYRSEDRDPTDVELETLAQTWSEHCVHKTFKAKIAYTEYDRDGQLVKESQIDGLFKSLIAAPTYELKKDWIVSAFVDNAGIISFDDDYEVSFKVETHNHPSALEPFGGANTGLGGVIRDVMAVSAKPIASTDVFCFGEMKTPADKIPADVLPPTRIFQGVVDGVRDYGNKMGIPTVNGAILFDQGYLANPLVFCGTVGLAPKGKHPRNQQPGDRVIVIGGRTGRDGIHGATFSSIELGGDSQAAGSTTGQAASVVQIGNPIEEKKTLDLLLKARDRGLYTALTDCGAGGLSSAVGEMGAELGVRVELARVPLKYAGLEPWEIWVSEAQERMVLAVSPDKLAEFQELCQLEDVEATDLGEFTGDGWLTLLYNEETVGRLRMEFLHHGLPRRHMEARWQPPALRTAPRQLSQEPARLPQDYVNDLKNILADPNVASKEAVIRVYDHEVQGGTIMKPLVGIMNDGPGDAAIIKPLTNSNRGLVISNGINPRYGLLDPYHMAANAIDEAIRNAVAVGANLDRMALLDNFCWGNPAVPERLGELTRAVLACRDYALAFSLPYISGKDSLNNEFKDMATGNRVAIPGTLLISAFAVMDDVTKAVSMDLKEAGNLVYLVGKTKPELGGSYYAKYHGQFESEVPQVDAAAALKTFRGVHRAIQSGLVRSCHDLSEGGLAVAAAEMAFSGGLGVRFDLTHVPYSGPRNDRTNTSLLFSETPSRFLVEVEPENKAAFEKAVQGGTFAQIGQVIPEDEFTVTGLTTATVMRVRVSDLKKAWQTPLVEL